MTTTVRNGKGREQSVMKNCRRPVAGGRYALSWGIVEAWFRISEIRWEVGLQVTWQQPSDSPAMATTSDGALRLAGDWAWDSEGAASRFRRRNLGFLYIAIFFFFIGGPQVSMFTVKCGLSPFWLRRGKDTKAGSTRCGPIMFTGDLQASLKVFPASQVCRSEGCNRCDSIRLRLLRGLKIDRRGELLGTGCAPCGGARAIDQSRGGRRPADGLRDGNVSFVGHS